MVTCCADILHGFANMCNAVQSDARGEATKSAGNFAEEASRCHPSVEIMIRTWEEDILNDRELELLELPPNCWKIRVIRWPCFLLCNELLLALTQAKELENESDTSLWLKICKSEYRRCAIIEAYDSIKYLFLMILKVDKVEFSIVTNIFREID
ncbi:hypothetical protein RYX36_028210 [Vicia faba]